MPEVIEQPGLFYGITALPLQGYDAAETTTKRRPPAARDAHEDTVLNGAGRNRVVSSARDVHRNFAVASWMVRKHLDYVASFNFQSQSGDDGWDDELEWIVEEWSSPESCHDAGLLDFESLLRIAECCAVLEGDCGLMKIESGHLQGFEADLITNPDKIETGERWYNGVRVAGVGPLKNRPIEYGVCRYGSGGRAEFDRRVSAQNFYLHRYASRFNQYRGVSPIVSGINSLKDAYEGVDLAVAKMKVEQLFALAFYRDADESAGDLDKTEAVDEEGNEVNRGGYKVNFNKGPVLLDLDPGDRAEFLKSDNPGSNTREFLMAVLMIALKSLDIPYSFFDESFTNFFGARAAWMHYNRSAKFKRRNLQRLANWWLSWRIQLAIQSRQLSLPRKLTLDRPWWQFVPIGMPWWDPAKEIAGDIASIEAGLNTPQRIVRERDGGDFYENLKEIGRAIEAAKKAGVSLKFDSQSLIEKTADANRKAH